MAKAIPQHRTTTAKQSHTPKRKHTPRENRSHSTARGYDTRWARFRASFLASNPLCEYCMARGIVEPATVCDHDLPHDHDPELFWNNTYTALCKRDHDSTKQRMERQYSGDDLLRAIAKAKGKPY